MKRMFAALTAVAIAVLGLVAADPAAANQLEEIKKKGVLVVGVKTDYPPWGMRDSTGNIVGMEPDMAADVAKRLGVKLELVSVVSSNRMQFLQQGKIDLMIATMSDTPERRKVVGTVDPVYYASGVAILANKAANIKSAADLKGKPVCALQGAFYNNDLQSKYTGQDLVAFKGVPEAEQALLDGRCVGFVYDDVVLVWKKAQDKKWDGFDVVQLNEWKPVPWGLAVKIEELEGPFGKFMAEVLKDWLKSGTLAALEKKWVGNNTPWLIEATAAAKK
ncbi:MAG: transporter substrate-binding domain-containing protein [Hyphomicrobiaceae bacterium]